MGWVFGPGGRKGRGRKEGRAGAGGLNGDALWGYGNGVSPKTGHPREAPRRTDWLRSFPGSGKLHLVEALRCQQYGS